MRCDLCDCPEDDAYVAEDGTVACSCGGSAWSVTADGVDPEDLAWGFHVTTLDPEDDEDESLAAMYPEEDL